MTAAPTPAAQKLSAVAAGTAAAGLFLASLLLPPLGFFLCLASPLPLAVETYRRGVSGALLAALAGTSLAGLVAGGIGATVFLSQFALGGCVLGLRARAGGSPTAVIGSYTLVSALGFGAGVLVLATLAGSGPLAFLRQALDEQVQQALGFWIAGADAAAAQELRVMQDSLRQTIIRVFPGVFLALAMLTGWGNTMGLRRVTRTAGHGGWNLWRAPEAWIWALIASGLLALLGSGGTAAVAMNVFIVAATIYFLQGMAVVQYLFEVRGFPRLLRGVAYVMLFQTPVMLLVAGVGAFDLWFDFRTRMTPPPATETNA